MIAAFDVHYTKGGASTAAVLFNAYTDKEPAAVYVHYLYRQAAAYIPGEFFKRELPCILTLMEKISHPIIEMIVDGYVFLGDKPGLGWYLFDAFDGKIPVIGIAKSQYEGATGIEIFRGKSRRPLYITSAGLAPETASQKISTMHGDNRVPTLLRRVDRLARKNAGG